MKKHFFAFSYFPHSPVHIPGKQGTRNGSSEQGADAGVRKWDGWEAVERGQLGPPRCTPVHPNVLGSSLGEKMLDPG